MATKNISITVEAYKRLAARKKEKESFSEVINREFGKAKLRELHGILRGEAGKELEKNILEGRKLHKKMHKKRAEWLLKELS